MAYKKKDWTANCIVCGKPTNMVGGHVHRGDTTLLAGFCKGRCEETRYDPDFIEQNGGVPCTCRAPLGCFGTWKESDGVREMFDSREERDEVHPT